MDLRERTNNPHRHPWELSRADMVLSLLSRYGEVRTYADVGSGDLYFARRLQQETRATVYAIDVNYEQSYRDNSLIVCMDVGQVPPGSVECALLMDVLEHVPDDKALLGAVREMLVPDGAVLITVPAHGFLWSNHDEFLGHQRRYTPARLADLLEATGLQALQCFHFYSLPLLARAASVGLAALRDRGLGRVNGVRASVPGTPTGSWPYDVRHPLTRTLRAALNCDFRVCQHLAARGLPTIGLSICAICRPSA